METSNTPKRWALILGASSGFGAACSKALAEAGFNIFGVHLDRKVHMPRVQQVIDACAAAGAEVHFFNMNVADDKNRLELLVEIGARLSGTRAALTEADLADKLPADVFARLKAKASDHPLALADVFASDVKLSYESITRLSNLVLPQIHAAMQGAAEHVYAMLHSVAFGSLNLFIDEDVKKQLTRPQLEMTLDVMANSLVYWVQDMARADLLTRGSKIFGMTSAGSHRVIPGYGPVSAAKAALESHVRQLALELGGRGILVNCFQAGLTDTPAMRMVRNSDMLVAEALKRTAGNRLTTPDDIAHTFVALMDPKLTWVTGTIIRVDGGEDNI